MLSGSPVKAACWYLSNSDIQGALYCLLRGHELELVVSVCLSIQIKNPSFKMGLIYLAWRCVGNREWDIAIETLDLCPGTENEKIAICVNCELSTEEKNFLHEKVRKVIFYYFIHLIKNMGLLVTEEILANFLYSPILSIFVL
ncbi:unnamed protein product [Larinioides sclopetarius]|uniref:Uncharacterized protein n=1 Tax=Larinioides sclopetarius TaxID=280406 RepID=A0AAV1YSC2_9ARAC